MNNLNKDLEVIKSNMRTQTIIVITLAVLFIAGCYVSYKLGYTKRQIEVLDNAQKVTKQNKTLYSNQDLEIIIFGEPQL